MKAEVTFLSGRKCRSDALGAGCFGDVLCGTGCWRNARRGGNLLGAFGILCTMNGESRMIGHRVLVDGMMGSGKSTFARALAARTGLPVIHLDVHYWKPGWVRPSDDEWRERQCALLAGEAWIIDGNYNETLALRLERAETVVARSCGGFASPLARCPRAARTRSTDACATSGAALGGFGATAVQNLGTHAPRSCGTGLTRRCTCSVRGRRRGRFLMPSAARGHHPRPAHSADCRRRHLATSPVRSQPPDDQPDLRQL